LTPNHHPRWSRRPDPVWRRLYTEAGRLCALTRFEAEELVSLGVDAQRIIVTGIGPILSSEPTAPAILRSKYQLPEGRYVTFVGQQFKYKRVDLVIKAFELLAGGNDDLFLVVAGPLSKRTLKLRTRSRFRDRIFVLGSVPLADKTSLLAMTSLLIFPSEQESFGGVLIEAAWLGTPFVASDLPPLQEVRDAIGLGVCTSRDAEDIAHAAEFYLNTTPDRERILRDIRPRLEERFGWDSLARRYLDAYKDLPSANGDQQR
jgi:glycosyltransferase involved in cell wall biosynthesis